jgi:hypothetical protein
MPNWCINTIKVSGPTARVQAFLDTVSSVNEDGHKVSFDFEKITPMPTELSDIHRGSMTGEGLALLDPSSTYSDFCLNVWRVADHDPRFGKVDRETGPFPTREAALEVLLTSESTHLKECLRQARLVLAAREKYGFDDWYDWSVANWGSKWNACESDVLDTTVEEALADNKETASAELRFDTAWSWPEPILRKVVSMFPELVFEMAADEEGGWFYLDARGENGVLVVDAFGGVREGGPYDFDDDNDDGAAPADTASTTA